MLDFRNCLLESERQELELSNTTLSFRLFHPIYFIENYDTYLSEVVVKISIQASEMHNSIPRLTLDNTYDYECFEILASQPLGELQAQVAETLSVKEIQGLFDSLIELYGNPVGYLF